MQRAAARRHERRAHLHGSTGRHLTFGDDININQVDPRFLPLGMRALTQNVPTRSSGIPSAGRLQHSRRDDPAQPAAASVPAVRQRQHAAEHAGALAVSRRRHPAHQARHRLVGRPHQLHLQPAVGQPVRPGQLLLERARHPEQLHGHSGVGVLQSRRGIRPQPARLAAQGGGEPDHPAAVRRGPALASNERLEQLRRSGGWTVSAVIQMQSGFPLGVSQTVNNTNLLGAAQRPNVVPGVDIHGAGQHHRSPARRPERQPVPESRRVRAGAGRHFRQRAAHARRRLLAVAQLDGPGDQQGPARRRRAAR